MISMNIRHLPNLDYQLSEAMNTLCANLSIAGGDIRKILVTSCHPREGKSFITMNLFRAMAELGNRVILVDADIRASTLPATYGITIEPNPDKYPGLCGYLSGLCDIDSIIGHTNVEKADMILPGRIVMNSFPLFNSPRLKELLDYLVPKYDVVLIDAPPVGTIIDAAKIAQHCNGALFIVESGSVTVNELRSATAQIEKTGCPIMGYVINKVDSSVYGKKSYYAYYSGSDKATPSKKRHYHKSF